MPQEYNCHLLDREARRSHLVQAKQVARYRADPSLSCSQSHLKSHVYLQFKGFILPRALETAREPLIL